MKKLILFIVAFSYAASISAAKDQKSYHLKWKEDSGKIVHSSVCYNYKARSIDFRRCRSQAKKHFKTQCKHYKSKSNDFVQVKKKFCLAAHLFNPIVF